MHGHGQLARTGQRARLGAVPLVRPAVIQAERGLAVEAHVEVRISGACHVHGDGAWRCGEGAKVLPLTTRERRRLVDFDARADDRAHRARRLEHQRLDQLDVDAAAGHGGGPGPEREPEEVRVVPLARADPFPAEHLAGGVELEHVLVAVGARVPVDGVSGVPVLRRRLADVLHLALHEDEARGGGVEVVALRRDAPVDVALGEADEPVRLERRDVARLGHLEVAQRLVPHLVVVGAVFDERLLHEAEVVGEEHVVRAGVGVAALTVGVDGPAEAVERDAAAVGLRRVLVAPQRDELAARRVVHERAERLEVLHLEGHAVARDGVLRLGEQNGRRRPRVTDAPPRRDAAPGGLAPSLRARLAEKRVALTGLGARLRRLHRVDAVGARHGIFDVHATVGAIEGEFVFLRRRVGARAAPLRVDVVFERRPVTAGPRHARRFAFTRQHVEAVLERARKQRWVVLTGPRLTLFDHLGRFSVALLQNGGRPTTAGQEDRKNHQNAPPRRRNHMKPRNLSRVG